MRRVRVFVVNNVGTLTLVVALLASLSANVVFARRLGLGHKPPEPIGAIKLGSVVPTVHVRSLDGARRDIVLNGQKSLVYVMSPSCGWCTKNHQNIVTLAKSVKDRYQIVGLSISGTPEVLRKHLAKSPLPFDVFIIEEGDLDKLTFAQATPTTIVVDESARITNAWVGAYNGSRFETVSSFFRVTLPGLQ